MLSHLFFFFFNDTATTEIYTRFYTLSLHDALPISGIMQAVNEGAGTKMSFGVNIRLPFEQIGRAHV